MGEARRLVIFVSFGLLGPSKWKFVVDLVWWHFVQLLLSSRSTNPCFDLIQVSVSVGLGSFVRSVFLNSVLNGLLAS